MTPDIGVLSFATAAAAFLGLMVLVAVSWQAGPVGGWLVLASGATALWAGVVSYLEWIDLPLPQLTDSLEVLRTAGWLAFLISVLALTRRGEGMRPAWFRSAVLVGAGCAVTLFAQALGQDFLSVAFPALQIDLALLGRLALAVCGMLLVENLLRNTRPVHRWGLKFLCFGVGGLFAYDFFMYAEAMLFHRVSPDLDAARGVADAMVVPLIALSARRNPTWSIDIFVSRRVVFHSATLIGAGFYLLVMAGGGFYVREFGGEWGTVLQAAFLFGALLLLLLILFSGTVRARLKDVISRNFFRYKYDYRDEWLRFIDTIASTDQGIALPLRVTEGIANIVESPAGAVLTADGETSFALLASWNMEIGDGNHQVDPSFTRWFEKMQSVLDLGRAVRDPDFYRGVLLPDWLRQVRRAWLVVPLLHHDRLLGVLVLGQSRSPRQVSREDYVLLTTVGRQAASYLAEREAGRALAEAQQFDEFNRRFAFVLHDIKNLVSQLSVMLKNAQKHRDNPAFQEDMLETVKESVDKMNRLLVRLHQSGREASATARVELSPLLRKVIERYENGSDNRLRFQSEVDDVVVVADEERLGAVFAHLLDNALAAVKGRNDGFVVVRLGARGGEAVIEIEDNGKGMDKDFVRHQLFRPFHTTKEGGFGIGIYESRAFVRELGGRMDVASEPDRGTRIRICLPAMTSNDTPELLQLSLGVQ